MRRQERVVLRRPEYRIGCLLGDAKVIAKLHPWGVLHYEGWIRADY